MMHACHVKSQYSVVSTILFCLWKSSHWASFVPLYLCLLSALSLPLSSLLSHLYYLLSSLSLPVSLCLSCLFVCLSDCLSFLLSLSLLSLSLCVCLALSLSPILSSLSSTALCLCMAFLISLHSRPVSYSLSLSWLLLSVVTDAKKNSYCIIDFHNKTVCAIFL